MNNIKDLRRRMGLTQIELAKELNISQGSLSAYETGRTTIDNDMLIRFAKYFNVSIDEILGIDTTPSQLEELTEVEFALSGEIRQLTEAEKQDVLDYVRFKRSQRNKMQ